MSVCFGCQRLVTLSDTHSQEPSVEIERFDRVEGLYLSMADFAALHQMRTDYPTQTRTLIEDVLCLGPVNAPDINTRLLIFFQDSTLQTLITDVERQYADVSDLNKQLTNAFRRLSKMMPGITVPSVYTQIGSLDQSIIVTDSTLGICLDKYLGPEYPAYLRYGYTEDQRQTMARQYIVPDAIGVYLMSLYPLPPRNGAMNEQRHRHVSKIQCVVNKVMGRKVFTGEAVERLESEWRANPSLSAAGFLENSTKEK